ncbi:MAG: hypothetical protein WBB19_13250 [Desulforhopalus sp.]
METDTLILMGFLAIALSWYFAINIVENRQLIKRRSEQEKEKQGRAERVRQLTNKL